MRKISFLIAACAVIALASCAGQSGEAEAEKIKADSLAAVAEKVTEDSLFNAAAAAMSDTLKQGDTTQAH